MKVKVITVGGDTKDLFKTLGISYLERTYPLLSPKLIIVEEKKRKSKNGSQNQAELLEGQALLEASTGCFRIALDERGKEQTSVEFTQSIQKILERGQPIAFLIGGASGLSEEVRKESQAIWSLSRMTLPHRMAFCFLAEQIYRAGEIWRNSPYHKI